MLSSQFYNQAQTNLLLAGHYYNQTATTTLLATKHNCISDISNLDLNALTTQPTLRCQGFAVINNSKQDVLIFPGANNLFEFWRGVYWKFSNLSVNSTRSNERRSNITKFS